MPIPLQERLKQKGWPDEDIKYALAILKKADQEKPSENFGKRMAPVTYWLALIITIIGNIIITLALVPALFLLKGSFLYVVIIVFGVTFGTLFTFITNNLEQIDKNHSIIASVFIPAIAIITTIVMVTLANDFARKLKIETHDPYLISFAYVIAFMLPYILQKIIDYITTKRQAGMSA